MTVLDSAVDTRAEAFRRNDAAMRALVADLRDKVAEIKLGGGAAVRERHHVADSAAHLERADGGVVLVLDPDLAAGARAQ